MRSSDLDGNVHKTPLAITLPQLANARAADAIAELGRGLPCTVSQVVSPRIVEVTFAINAAPKVLQPMQVPVAAPPYVLYPVQVGDKGCVVSVGTRLGQMTGLGAGTPNWSDTVGNLSSLAFVWLGNTADTTIDADAVVLMGNVSVGGPPVDDDMSLGFFATPKVTRQEVTGALSSVSDPAAKNVLTSLVDALAAYGLIENSTT